MEELIFNMSQVENFEASYQAWIASRTVTLANLNLGWMISLGVFILSGILARTFYHMAYLANDHRTYAMGEAWQGFIALMVVSGIIFFVTLLNSYCFVEPRSQTDYIRRVESSLSAYNIIVE